MRVSITVLIALSLLTGVSATAGVTTDKPEYIVGEIVHITYTNSGGQPQTIGPDYAFRIVHVASGLEVMYDTFWVGTLLLPGESISSPHDTGLLPDPTGEYVIWCKVGSWVYFGSYLLDDGIANENATLGDLKRLFR